MDEKEKILRYIQELATRIHSLRARVERLKGSTLKTVSGDPATFDDAVPYIALKQLKVNIDPVQSGSGDPSPTNVRPISGWTEVNVRVYNESEDNSYNIPLGQTVYGGVLDVVSGILRVDKAMVDLGSLAWTRNKLSDVDWYYFRCEPSGMVNTTTIGNNSAICSTYKSNGVSYVANMGDDSFTQYGITLFFRDDAYSDLATFRTSVTGQQLVYELATPITYQLTPTEVRTLLGDNNIWSDTGSVEVTYRAKYTR